MGQSQSISENNEEHSATEFKIEKQSVKEKEAEYKTVTDAFNKKDANASDAAVGKKVKTQILKRKLIYLSLLMQLVQWEMS